MGLINEEIIQFKIDVDPRTGIKSVRKFDKEFMRSIADTRKAMKALDKVNKGFFSEASTAWGDYKDEIEDTAVALKELERTAEKASNEIAEAQDYIAANANSTTESVKKRVKELEVLIETNKDVVTEARKAKDNLAAIGQQTINIRFAAATEEIQKSLASVTEPFSKLFSKDVPGAIAEGGKLAASAIESALRKSGQGIAAKGASWKEKGTALASKGAAMKAAGQGGGGTAMMGKMASMMGGAMKSIGPMIESFSKFAPLISVASAGIAGLVKFFLDAQAQAKSFNKDLLATASTGEFMTRNANKAEGAYGDLDDTLKNLRDSAFNLKQNMAWGTTNKDHLAFRNTLTSEGVSIKRMADEFDHAKKNGEIATDAVDYFSQQTATAVGYSRLFGVSLGEITQLQSHMMTEMGSSFKDVEKEFAYMQQGAATSGMAMNKFFSIMKGVSQDLSLYNMRMSDAVGLLNKLGKAMSPANAQKFMQQLAQGFKGMGRLDRLKMTLLAGEGKTREIFEKDAKSREQTLVKKLVDATGQDSATVSKAVADYGAGKSGDFKNLIKGLEGEGTFRGEARALKQDRKMAKKGVFGLAQATGNMGPMAQQKMLKASIGRFSKLGPNASLSDMQGELGPEMMAENMGISREQLDNMTALEDAMDDAREEMRNSSNAQIRADAENEDEVLKFTGMSKDDAADASKSALTFAKEQGDLTTNLLDRLNVLIDWAMNAFYNAFLGLWDSVDVLNKGKDQRELAKTMRGVKDKDLQAAYNKSGGSGGDLRHAVAGGDVGKKFVGLLDEITKIEAAQREQIKNEINTGEVSDTPEDIAKRYSELQKGDPRLQELYKVQETANNQLTPEALKKIMDASGMSQEKKDAVHGQLYTADRANNNGASGGGQGEVATGKDSLSALQDAGLSREEVNEILKKALWESSEKGMLDIGTAVGSVKPGEAAGPAPVRSAKDEDLRLAKLKATLEAGAGKTQAIIAADDAKRSAPGGTSGALGALSDASKATMVSSAAQVDPAVAANQLGLTQQQYDAQVAMWDLADAQAASLEQMVKKGTKMDKAFLKGPYAAQMEDSIYEAMSKAMFEYWLYSADDKDIEKRFKEMADAGETGSSGKIFGAQQKKYHDEKAGFTVPANDAGGYVSGIHNGVATITAARGEGLASIGKGEFIGQQGAAAKGTGGGSSSSLSLDVNVTGAGGADFQKGLKTLVSNYIYEYESRKRLQ